MHVSRIFVRFMTKVAVHMETNHLPYLDNKIHHAFIKRFHELIESISAYYILSSYQADLLRLLSHFHLISNNLSQNGVV